MDLNERPFDLTDQYDKLDSDTYRLIHRPSLLNDLNSDDDQSEFIQTSRFSSTINNTFEFPATLETDSYLKHCFEPRETSRRIWKIKVFGVCTDKSPLLDNWTNSLKKNGYDHQVLGLGEKWGGWPWRTKQYIKALAYETEEKLFILTDANDLYFISPPHELIYNFRTYRSDIVLGCERSPSTGPLRHSFSLRADVIAFAKSRNTSTRYLVPNGGFVMGFRTPLLNLLCGNANEEDDQHGYLTNWLEHPEFVKLDIYARLVANVVYDTPFLNDGDDERNEDDYFNLVSITDNITSNNNINESRLVTTGNYRIGVESTETKARPCAMHFPGKNSQGYNYYGQAIFGSSFNTMDDDHLTYKESFKNVVKKSWTLPIKQKLAWISSSRV